MQPRNEQFEWTVLDVDESGEHDIPEQLDYWMVEEFEDIFSNAQISYH